MRWQCCKFFLSLWIVNFAWAFDYSDQQVPYQIPALEARSAALGGAAAALVNSPYALTANPALLSFSERTWIITVGGAGLLQREDRARPTFDTFDEIIYYNEYVLNEQSYGRLFAAAQLRIPQKAIPALVLGLGYLPRSSRDYEYFEEVRGTFSNGGLTDQVLGYNTIQTRGGTNAIALAVAAEPVSDLAIGISLSFLSGHTESTRHTAYLDKNEPDSLAGWLLDYEESPLELNLGWAYRWQQRLVLGLDIQPAIFRHSLRCEDRSSGEVTYPEEKPPTAISLGASYCPTNPVRTLVTCTARAELWSQYERSDQSDLALRDIVILAAGVEHRVLEEVPIRLGFRYSPSPADPNLSGTSFSFGTGFHLLGSAANAVNPALQLDLAAEIGTLSYYQTDLFPEALFGGTNYSGEDRVQERSFRAFATLTYSHP